MAFGKWRGNKLRTAVWQVAGVERAIAWRNRGAARWCLSVAS